MQKATLQALNDKQIMLDAKVEKIEGAVEKLERAVFGDGNGEKGLIRRVDDIEHKLDAIRKQNWMIIGILLSLLGEVLYTILVK